MKRTYIALLLTLVLGSAEFAVPAYAQNADRSAYLRSAEAVRESIRQHWSPNVEIAKFHGMRGSVRFDIDNAGRLVGRPDVTVTGGTAVQRAQIARNVQAIVQGASPFPRPPNTAFSGVMKFRLPFQFD